jgi:phospholipid transport system substrate-binding protein
VLTSTINKIKIMLHREFTRMTFHEMRPLRLRRYFATLFALLLSLGTGVAVANAQATPEAAVQAAVGRILSTVQQERASLEEDPTRVRSLLDEGIAPFIDFDGMSQLVLGRYWRSASQEQRLRFVQAFRGFLVRFYATAVEEFILREGIPDDLAIELLPSPPAEGDRSARVRTAIQQPGSQPIGVDYTLYRRGDVWRVVDIQVEGISLVVSYRQSFAGEIRNRGLDGLIAQLAGAGA